MSSEPLWFIFLKNHRGTEGTEIGKVRKFNSQSTRLAVTGPIFKSVVGIFLRKLLEPPFIKHPLPTADTSGGISHGKNLNCRRRRQPT